MIAAVAFLPQPPLLLRANQGLVDAAPELRAACLAAVRDATAGADRVAVLFAVPEAQSPHRPPLGLRVAHELLDETGWGGRTDAISVPDRFGATECAAAAAAAWPLFAPPEPVALLVMADGSARRGIKSPGHLDERAAPFDARFVAAVRDGDRKALGELEPDLARELLFAGRAPLGVLAELPLPDPAADLRWSGDPFGVQYVVALWTLPG